MHAFIWITKTLKIAAAAAVVVFLVNTQRRAFGWMNSVLWTVPITLFPPSLFLLRSVSPPQCNVTIVSLYITFHMNLYIFWAYAWRCRLHSVIKQYQWTVSHWPWNKSRVYLFSLLLYIVIAIVKFVCICIDCRV